MTQLTIRDALPDDAPFLAKCVMAGMHFYDFEEEVPQESAIFERLTACEQRDDLLYSYVRTRVAEVDGVAVGSLLSYPGEIYRDLRHKTFTELWPEFSRMDADSQQETGPGEYYLDTLAVLPQYRGKGIGHRLIRDSIEKGISLGYTKISLVADTGRPDLIALYASLGFRSDGHRHAFGVDFQRMVLTVGGAAPETGRNDSQM